MDSTGNPSVAGAPSQNAAAASTRSDNPFSRDVRDLLKAGTCFICTEQEPNIATLCCGQAVHFHCISKWFVDPSHDSCPYCRAQVQTCPEAQQQEQEPPLVIVPFLQCQYCSNPAALDCDNGACGRCCYRYSHAAAPCVRHGTDGIISEVEEGSEGNAGEVSRETMDDYAADYGGNSNDYQPHLSIEYEDDHYQDDQNRGYDPGIVEQYLDDQYSDHYSVDSYAQNEPDHNATTQSQTIVYCQDCDRRAALDCVNGSCKRCCLANGFYDCARHGLARENEYVQNYQPPRPQCIGCTNVAAQDCINNCCAHCCEHHGEAHCNRHGV